MEYLINHRDRIRVPICVIGKPKSGKTTFINNYVDKKKAQVDRAANSQEKSKRRRSIRTGIEKLQYLYKDQVYLNVEVWDTVGQEKFNEEYIYSQNYVQGKRGVILIIDATEERDQITKKINLLRESMDEVVPICVFITMLDKIQRDKKISKLVKLKSEYPRQDSASMIEEQQFDLEIDSQAAEDL